jgi:hypothetical protein
MLQHPNQKKITHPRIAELGQLPPNRKRIHIISIVKQIRHFDRTLSQ